ncbi:MAG: fumarylacetoacetate hydrolase family protein [Gemmatimonadales bacterium]|nr:fumarylacetoacetate hydrolase family protein [Gemmatimonadales bacterium]
MMGLAKPGQPCHYPPMKLITYTQGSNIRPGLALSEFVGLDLIASNPSLPGNWHALFPVLDQVRLEFNRHTGQLAEMETICQVGNPLPLPFFDLKQVTLLSPIVLPSKIIAVGMNYRDHAEEQNKPLPPRPMLFSKAPSCLQIPGGPIELPEDLDQVDAEAELAVVIGRPGRRITRERARDHIAGYTCFNDISDRAAQYADKQFFRGKSIDTGGPCGPWIVTPDELPDLAAGLDIRCRWNGQIMQESNTGQLIFQVDELIRHASANMTLLPGDIISTGTPGGVGAFRDPQIFLKPGDVVEVEIEGIGTLSNPVQRWKPQT